MDEMLDFGAKIEAHTTFYSFSVPFVPSSIA
jgi:hypothetical protein